MVRQQLWWRVVVRNAKTGGWVTEKTFYGSMPGSCPYQYRFYSSVAYKTGSAPSSTAVIDWLRGIVK